MSLVELLAELRQPWMEKAACKGAGVDAFFPDQNPPKEVLAICNTQCSVREECLQYAIDSCEQHGIWGGRTRSQRRRLRAYSFESGEGLKECRMCGTRFVPVRPDHVSCSRGCALEWVNAARRKRRGVKAA